MSDEVAVDPLDEARATLAKMTPLEGVEAVFRSCIAQAVENVTRRERAKAWLDTAERLAEIRAKLQGPVFDAADLTWTSASGAVYTAEVSGEGYARGGLVDDLGVLHPTMPALEIKGVSFYEDGDELGWGYTCQECEKHVAGVAKTEGYEYARGWLTAAAESHAFEVHLPGPENRAAYTRGPEIEGPLGFAFPGCASVAKGDLLLAEADPDGKQGPVGKVVRLRETLAGLEIEVVAP